MERLKTGRYKRLKLPGKIEPPGRSAGVSKARYPSRVVRPKRARSREMFTLEKAKCCRPTRRDKGAVRSSGTVRGQACRSESVSPHSFRPPVDQMNRVSDYLRVPPRSSNRFDAFGDGKTTGFGGGTSFVGLMDCVFGLAGGGLIRRDVGTSFVAEHFTSCTPRCLPASADLAVAELFRVASLATVAVRAVLLPGLTSVDLDSLDSTLPPPVVGDRSFS
jgi:hypothetical protein